ncbi:MAG: class I SAM-dependent methyltransferase [Nocardioidaceae bacterium]
MTATAAATTPTEAPDSRREDLAERLFAAFLSGAELLSVDLGRRLGLYEVLRQYGPVTAAELARAAEIAERYAREWLEQQAVAGILDVAAETGQADTRRYVLPDGHASALLDPEDPANLMATAPMLTGLALTLPAVVEAYRTGGGVTYADFGTEIRHGISGLNRPVFATELPGWLATMPDVAERLTAGGSVLDAGCGVGWSSITIARTFPRTQVKGIDLDPASIVEARRNIAAAGLADRVVVDVADAAEAVDGAYDLACIFEALHDMADPVGALRSLRGALAPGAPVFVVDERVADEFTAPADEIERMQYIYSVLHCLPATMAESTAVANGTVLRAPTVRAWAEEAGFASVEELPIENDVWRFYRLSDHGGRGTS